MPNKLKSLKNLKFKKVKKPEKPSNQKNQQGKESQKKQKCQKIPLNLKPESKTAKVIQSKLVKNLYKPISLKSLHGLNTINTQIKAALDQWLLPQDFKLKHILYVFFKNYAEGSKDNFRIMFEACIGMVTVALEC